MTGSSTSLASCSLYTGRASFVEKLHKQKELNETFTELRVFGLQSPFSTWYTGILVNSVLLMVVQKLAVVEFSQQIFVRSLTDLNKHRLQHDLVIIPK